MAFFQKNPFIAPDIKDVVAEKRSAVRTAMLVFGAGVVLVSVLLGGYQIGQWILWNTAPEIVAPVLPGETQPLITVESRLRELGGSGGGPVDMGHVVARVNELSPKHKNTTASPSTTPTVEDRMKELGN
jgi:hypothetical protein